MAKKTSNKREKAAEKAAHASGEDGYEFPMPNFDEKAFMRREIESARTTFWTAGLGVAAGVLAWVLGTYGGDWRFGWLSILGGLAAVGPALRKIGYSEEGTAPKAMFGNWFLLFFTALAVWILTVNLAS